MRFRKLTWKCAICGMTDRREPHRRLSDHMEVIHGQVWCDKLQKYVLKTNPPAVHLCPKCGKQMNEEASFPGLWMCPDYKVRLNDSPPFRFLCTGSEITKAGADALAEELNRLDPASIIERLKNLQRKDVGEFDEGGGNMCHYANESTSGRWVEWDDIQKLIDEFSTGGT
jgi:hypothetical protein